MSRWESLACRSHYWLEYPPRTNQNVYVVFSLRFTISIGMEAKQKKYVCVIYATLYICRVEARKYAKEPFDPLITEVNYK